MVELIRAFWWLVFPLAAVICGAWAQWMKSRTRTDEMRVLAAYAAAGKEPPAELLRALRRDPVEG